MTDGIGNDTRLARLDARENGLSTRSIGLGTRSPILLTLPIEDERGMWLSALTVPNDDERGMIGAIGEIGGVCT